MTKLSLLILAVAVGDKSYDPNVEIRMIGAKGHNTIACVAYTGYWTVTEVESLSDGGTEMRSASEEVTIIHSVFFSMPFNLNAYYKHKISVPRQVFECDEFERQMSRLNVCADFRGRKLPFDLVCK